MAWPLATDYSSVIQNPASCFADAELAAGQPVVDLLGLPLTYAGNFANVYKVLCPNEQAFAVKCFTRAVADLQERYAAISAHLERARRRFAVQFRYLEQGIKVKGAWYPILKMRWVEGFTLNEFLKDHAGNAALLEQLGGLWLRLATELRESRMGHGDLQHGNVLLVPGGKAAAMVLRLIDYDGMWVPDLADRPPGEMGHPNYQHPQRLRQGGYFAEIDRFAHLVIYTALRCLGRGGQALWDRHDNAENLLFKESDFRSPASSRLWPELFDLPDPNAVTLAGHLLTASQRPLEEVPLLPEMLAGGKAAPLSAEQRDLVRALVPTARITRVPPPVSPAEVVAEWLPDTPQPGQPRRGKAVPAPAEEAVPEVIPVLPLAAEPAVAARAPEATLVLDPGSTQSLPVLPPELPATSKRTTTLDRPRTTVNEARSRDRSAPQAKTRPRQDQGKALLPVAGWLVSLGLPADSPIVRFWFLAPCALLVLPLLVGLVLWVAWPGLAQPGPGSAIVAELGPVPGPVEVRGGRTRELEMVVDRSGPDQALRIELTNLPPGVTCPDVAVPAGEGEARVKATLSADEDMDDATANVTAVLWRGGSKVDETSFELRVSKFLRPEMGEVAGIILTQGQSQDLVVQVKANGNTDPWTLTVESLPAGVKAQPINPLVPLGLPPGTRPMGVRLSAASDAPLTLPTQVKLVLRAGGLVAQEKSVLLLVEKAENVPTVELTLTLPKENTIVLRPGDKTRVRVQVVRRRCEGPVQLRVVQLPSGVSAAPVDLPARQSTAWLEFRMERSASLPPKHVVSIRPWMNGKEMKNKAAAFLEVGTPGMGTTETDRPERLPPVPVLPQPEDVLIPTADGLRLVGNFYPAPDATKGPVVLMLHDIQAGHARRKQPGWPQLAQQLQKQGCAVLTFDFRGFGDNLASDTRLPTTFFRHPANALLLRNRVTNPFGPMQAQVTTQRNLIRMRFPDAYLPWLVQDIVAARLWLDREHDDERVNSSNLVLIAEGESARLGAIWLATECRRRRAAPGSAYESRDLYGAVWLDVRAASRVLGSLNNTAVGRQLAGEKSWPPMLLLYNRGVPANATQVDQWGRTFNQAANSKKGLAGRAFGFDNLLTAAGASQEIEDYVANLIKTREPRAWSKRDLRRRQYVWDLGGGRTHPPKGVGTRPLLAPLDNWGFRALPGR
jgi:hypothetical protein